MRGKVDVWSVHIGWCSIVFRQSYLIFWGFVSGFVTVCW